MKSDDPKRRELPMRRINETYSFRCGNHLYQGTVGFYEDGTPGEIFLDCSKSGTEVQIAARDSAIAVSMALQHGAPIEAIRSAFTRNMEGQPEGPLGTFLDLLASGALHE